MFSLNCIVLLAMLLYNRYKNSGQELNTAQNDNIFKRKFSTGTIEERYPTFENKTLQSDSFKNDSSETQLISSNKSTQRGIFQFTLLTEGNLNLNKNTSPIKPNTSSLSERSGSASVSDNITFQEKAREDSFQRTPPEKNPYSVLLVIYVRSFPQHTCTGSLITDRWVLTAAHCIIQANHRTVSYIGIYAGGSSADEYILDRLPIGSQSLTSVEFYAHPKYSRAVHNYDVAVVKANGRFRMSATVNTVGMSAVPWNFDSYTRCEFTGFGVVQINERHEDDKVRKTHIFEVKSSCRCAYRLKAVLGRPSVKGFLCARPREDYGVCPGDSGGGLICNGQLWGVAMQIIMMRKVAECSFTHFHNVKCGTRNTISVFESICPFLRWINKHVQLFNESEISKECTEPKDNGATIKPTLLCILGLTIINILFLTF